MTFRLYGEKKMAKTENGNGNGLATKLLMSVIGILALIACGLGGFSLKFQIEAHREHGITATKVAELLKESDDDIKQDSTLGKHWKLHNWARDRIIELRHVHGLPLEPWPKLNE